MKVLISDDEYHVIQAIRLLVPWDQLGIHQILTAGSGREAMEIIEREQPQLVITDIVMDDKSGLDLMTFIAANYPSIKVIAVSGHNDFEYVRAMLTKGCTDYLLKPLESDSLIQVVEKAVLNWRAEHESSLRHQNLKEQVQSLSHLYSGILLSQMLREPSSECYRQLMTVNPFFAALGGCLIAFYDTGYLPAAPKDSPALLERFKESCQVYLEQSGSGILLSNPDAPGEVVLFLYDNPDSLTSFLLKTAQSVFSPYGYPFHIGISRKYEFPLFVSAAFEEAREAFFLHRTDGRCPLIAAPDKTCPPDTAAGCWDGSPPGLHEIENQLRSSLLTGNQKELCSLISRWLSLFLPEEDSLLLHVRQAMDGFLAFYGECISMLCKKNPRFRHAPENCRFSYDRFLDKHALFSRELLKEAALSDLLLLWEELKKSSSNRDRMHQIAQYMELNYDKPFVQSQYARLFYINKDYMCRKFKDTFGVSMLTYLNQIRIQHAKALLSDPNMKIRDIAYAVGFEDEKYFARQFKKITHMTPGDYRAAR